MSLLKLARTSRNPYLEPDYVFRNARASKSRMWGDKYPPAELLADMELRRPVELGYKLLGIRYLIWELRDRRGTVGDRDETALSLLDQLLRVGEVSHSASQTGLKACSSGLNLMNRTLPMSYVLPIESPRFRGRSARRASPGIACITGPAFSSIVGCWGLAGHRTTPTAAPFPRS